MFSAQPQFYYYSGLAYNQVAQFKKQRNVGNGTGLSCRRQRINKLNYSTVKPMRLGDEKKKNFYFSKPINY
jgi:hypothetical protein